jgi:hypothetical protein
MIEILEKGQTGGRVSPDHPGTGAGHLERRNRPAHFRACRTCFVMQATLLAHLYQEIGQMACRLPVTGLPGRV